MYDVMLLRYGELSLKGKNRHLFEERLLENVRRAVKPLGLAPEQVKKGYGRLFVDLGCASETEVVTKELQKVFGLVSLSPARRMPLQLEAIKEAALQELLEHGSTGTFRVTTSRPYKAFPGTSPEISRDVGGYLLSKAPGWHVDLHQPQVVVNLELRAEGAFIYSRNYPGPGGLPVGTAGKVVLLISGGIDSPVAGWLAAKRGVELVGLHFHSFPFTSERSRQKVVDLCQVLQSYTGPFRLYINYFTEIQTAIRQNCPPEYYITIMRRMMFRLAGEIAAREGALAVVTGENLGQVASQTLESMLTINKVLDLPVLRPLITMDKQEIIGYAKDIGTYDLSILPYEDCCTLFVPEHPATRPKPERAAYYEENLDLDGLIRRSLEQTELVEKSD